MCEVCASQESVDAVDERRQWSHDKATRGDAVITASFLSRILDEVARGWKRIERKDIAFTALVTHSV